MSRPRILIPARFSASASALRFRAEVTAEKLAAAVFDAGGEPLTVHPHAPGGSVTAAGVAARFDFVHGVLLPGGGDLHPGHYGGGWHDEHYDVDPEQDAFDLAVARWALGAARPLLAVCRGLQVVNVVQGGTLVAHLEQPHRHLVSAAAVAPDSLLASVLPAPEVTISCFHHQALDELGAGLRATARSRDGVIEAVEWADRSRPWFLGVQWHPEDTAAADPGQHALFAALVEASRGRAGAVAAPRGVIAG